MKTQDQDLEQQLRIHYQQEFGEPSPFPNLWHQLAGRLPMQEESLTRRQRLLQALSLSRISVPFPPRLAPARRLVVVCSLLCALLVVSGLVYTVGVSWFHQSRTTGEMPTALSDTDALLLTQLLRSDPQQSIQQLAQSDQFNVNLTQTVNFETVKIQKVLADANDIVLCYTIDGKTALTGGRELVPTITLSDGQTLRPGQVRYTPSALSTSENGSPVLFPPVAVLAYFTTAPIQGHPQRLNLQIAIPAGGTTAHFDPTVPFYPGKTVTIDQTVTSDGHTITLERVVITPFDTRFYYTTGPGHAVLFPLVWNLSIAGKTYPSNHYVEESLTGEEDSVNFEYALQSDSGTWTVKLSLPAPVGKGTWQFTFSVV